MLIGRWTLDLGLECIGHACRYWRHWNDRRLVLVWRGDVRVGSSVCMVGALLTILNLSNYACRSTVRIFMSKVKLSSSSRHVWVDSQLKRCHVNISTPQSRSPRPAAKLVEPQGRARKGHISYFWLASRDISSTPKHCAVAIHHPSDAQTTPLNARRIGVHSLAQDILARKV